MKKVIRKFWAIALAFVICFTNVIPAMADGETNRGGVKFTLSLSETVLEKSNQAQTVMLSIKTSRAIDFVDMAYDLVCDNVFSVAEPTTPAGTASWNPDTKHMGWMASSDVNTDTLGTAVVTIPANTVGTYEFKVHNIALINNNEDFEEAGAYATATLTITDPSQGGGNGGSTTAAYTAAIDVPNMVDANGTVTAKVTVGGQAFNASELVLSYPSTLTAAASGETIRTYTENGKNYLVLEDYGEEKPVGHVYEINFTAAAVTEETDATVILESAAFVDKANADESDLIPATRNPESDTVKIMPLVLKVTLNSAASDLTATKYQPFTFAPSDTALYDYSNVKAYVNGSEVTISDNNDGTYTIAGDDVTGNINITFDKTPKNFDVDIVTQTKNEQGTVTGTTTDTITNGAQYQTDYTYTVPSNVAAGATNVGYTYSATATIEGSTFTVTAAAGQKLVIPGNEIIGKVTITVSKQVVPADGVSVTINGEDVTFADGTQSAVVSPGAKLNLTLAPESGYTYTVTVNGEEIMNDQVTTYELTVTGETVITVTKTLNGTAAVYEYVTLNNAEAEFGSIWLVTYDVELNGKVPTYDGNDMFYSEKYGAYCYLVLANTLDAETAAPKINARRLTDGQTITNVTYDKNINGLNTNVIDAADAQVIWNMYKAEYVDFSVMSMIKFLDADQNANSNDVNTYGLDVNDVLVVITYILDQHSGSSN